LDKGAEEHFCLSAASGGLMELTSFLRACIGYEFLCPILLELGGLSRLVCRLHIWR